MTNSFAFKSWYKGMSEPGWSLECAGGKDTLFQSECEEQEAAAERWGEK